MIQAMVLSDYKTQLSNTTNYLLGVLSILKREIL